MKWRSGAVAAALYVGFVLCTITSAPCLKADEADAKKYIESAQADAKAGNFGSVDTNLQLAETELDGLAADKKKALQAQIAAVRHDVAVAKAAAMKDDLTKDVASRLNTIKGDLDGNHDITGGLAELDEVVSKPEAKIALGDAEYGKVRKQMAAFRKVNAIKQAQVAMQAAQQQLDALDKDLPELLKQVADDSQRDGAARSFLGPAERIEFAMARLPEDKPEAKALIDRWAKMQEKFNAAYGKALAGEHAERMKRYWESYKDEYEGWEKETTGPTFHDLLSRQSDAMSRVNCPKSAALVARANDWLNNNTHDETYKIVAGDPRVKAVVESVTKMRDACHAKIAKFAEGVLGEAEKTKLTQDSRDRLATFVSDDLRISLEAYPGLATLQARGNKVVDAFDAATVGAAKAAEKAYADLSQAAASNWPRIVERYKGASEEFDPSAGAARGKVVHLKKVANRMGWDFKPGDFEFATTIKGVPVAGKFDPAVKEAVADVLKRTAKNDLPEEDYDLIAVVEGQGKLVQIMRSEATGTIEELKVKAKITEEIPVDAVALRIVALHVGPVGVSAR
jgi:hypothetical protein